MKRHIRQFVQPEPNRNNSFWFYGQTIAQVTIKGVTYIARAQGEIQVHLDEGRTFVSGDDAVLHAKEQNLNDRDIAELYDGDHFNGGNWFVIEKSVSESDDWSEVSIAPTTYDEAIAFLQGIVDEASNEKKYYKTSITITVLSENPIPECTTMEDLSREVEGGDYVSCGIESEETELTGRQMADELYNAGSEPAFFCLDDNGKKTEE